MSHRSYLWRCVTWLSAQSQVKSHLVTCRHFFVLLCFAGKELQRNAAETVQCKRKYTCQQLNPAGAGATVTLLGALELHVSDPGTNPPRDRVE